jgi:N-acetylmuramoyl-L-alanine amidase
MGDKTTGATRGRPKVIAKLIKFRPAAVAAFCVLLIAGSGFAVTRHTALARKAYQHAVELQQKLQARPAKARTAAEYKRVIREFRNVYYYDFAYIKAPIAAQAMGDIYAEMGRQFQEPGYFQDAIKAYQYVVSQYPVTSMARESALAVGKIYLDDLKDPAQAADAYQAFLKDHPRSPESASARKQLKEIADTAATKKEQEERTATGPESTDNTARESNAAPGNTLSRGGSRPSARGPVEVTDIHNWVGPNYTRVVIEAKGPFTYSTLRLSHPDRIVFDLSNTRLSRDLVRKGIPINGAFLHDIRAGQFKPDVTRVVLDVKDINNFSAFPLPNPFRLIIDVRGSSPRVAKNAPENAKPSAQVAEHKHSEQASVKKNPAVKQASAPRPAPQVETARETKPPAPQPASPAIVFEDQNAAKAAVESAVRKSAKQPTKEKPGAPSAQNVLEAAKQKPEAPSDHHVQEPSKSAADIASNPRPQETPTPKVESASTLATTVSAKKKTEVAAEQHSRNDANREIATGSNHVPPDVSKISTRPASPMEDGSQTLTRALGLKVARIVIDPGHGGFDTGTIGPTGLEEKNIVLDIGLRLRKLFETRTDSEVFMTRSTDKFVPLEERTAIANEDGADLFISIHANASSDSHVRGIETYFLNFTSDPEALQLAARENATSQESVHQLQNLIKKIALNNKIEESQELAHDIQTVLYRRMSSVSHGIHNRGVRKAPFVVLIGANMPSILTEISFLSNPRSERLLRQSKYREDIAKALFSGIENYINNLGSVRVAQRTH